MYSFVEILSEILLLFLRFLLFDVCIVPFFMNKVLHFLHTILLHSYTITWNSN